jgi:Fe-S cluster biogenesis protein NfuA
MWQGPAAHAHVRDAGHPGYPITVSGGTVMITRERVEDVLNRVRPMIQADGGDVELISVEDRGATIRMTGNCVGCPSAQMTLHFGIEAALRDEIPEFERLSVVN